MRTTSPVVGAWIILPSPTYMPTWWMDVQSLLSVVKNRRSPGRNWLTGPGVVARHWVLATLGRNVTPAERYAAHMRPEQSNRLGPSAPHSYGAPRCAIAYF